MCNLVTFNPLIFMRVKNDSISYFLSIVQNMPLISMPFCRQTCTIITYLKPRLHFLFFLFTFKYLLYLFILVAQIPLKYPCKQLYDFTT